jgi:hypothetical protein
MVVLLLSVGWLIPPVCDTDAADGSESTLTVKLPATEDYIIKAVQSAGLEAYTLTLTVK